MPVGREGLRIPKHARSLASLRVVKPATGMIMLRADRPVPSDSQFASTFGRLPAIPHTDMRRAISEVALRSNNSAAPKADSAERAFRAQQAYEMQMLIEQQQPEDRSTLILRKFSNVIQPDVDKKWHSIENSMTVLEQAVRCSVGETMWDSMNEQFRLQELFSELREHQLDMLERCGSARMKLSEEEQGRATVQRELDALKSRLDAVNFNGWADPPTLRNDVSTLESELLRIESNRDLTLPEEFNEIKIPERLVAVKLHRQDELLFLIRKRLSRFHSNEGLMRTIDLHGSLENLLSKNNELTAENKMLRAREIRFLHDPLLRRRVLKELDPSFLRCMVVALQNELTVCRAIMDEVDKQFHPFNGSIPVIDTGKSDEDARDRIDIDALYAKMLKLPTDDDTKSHHSGGSNASKSSRASRMSRSSRISKSGHSKLSSRLRRAQRGIKCDPLFNAEEDQTLNAADLVAQTGLVEKAVQMEQALLVLSARVKSASLPDLHTEGKVIDLKWQGIPSIQTQTLIILNHIDQSRTILKECADMINEQHDVVRLIAKQMKFEQLRAFKLMSFLVFLQRARPDVLKSLPSSAHLISEATPDPSLLDEKTLKVVPLRFYMHRASFAFQPVLIQGEKGDTSQFDIEQEEVPIEHLEQVIDPTQTSLDDDNSLENVSNGIPHSALRPLGRQLGLNSYKRSKVQTLETMNE